MVLATRARRAAAARGLSIGQAPRAFVAYTSLVDVVVLSWAVFALLSVSADPSTWIKLALLGVLAMAYEEGGKRVARLKTRLGTDLTLDMTSVWGVAAAVALPAALIAVLVSALGVCIWVRQERPAGKPAHRAAFNVANAALSAMSAGFVFHHLTVSLHGLPATLATAVPIAVAIIVHGIVNRAVATVALTLNGAKVSDLIGSAHDNLVEFATLCLGGLVALAALFEPWLVILAIAPMVSLQRGALVRELETAATTDSKTGLYNAVTWERIAQRELTRGERTATSTAILIIDLDRFKLVNDAFGHLAGDRVLRAIGERLRDEVREYDTVGRFGGEEFVAVLPNAGDVDALVVAERLRARINDLRIADLIDGVERGSDRDARIAASIGVACSPHDGAELTDLLYAADAALYRAKNLGRNRVALAERGTGNAEHVAAN